MYWRNLSYIFTIYRYRTYLSCQLFDRLQMPGLWSLAYVHCLDAVGFCCCFSGKSSIAAAKSSTVSGIAAIFHALHQNRAPADAPCTKLYFVVLYCSVNFIWYRKELAFSSIKELSVMQIFCTNSSFCIYDQKLYCGIEA